MTEKEKEILQASKEFAERNDISYDERIESMILNAMREIVKNCSIPDVVKSLPTDDELDEAAVEYCKSVYSDRPEMDDYQDSVEAFDAGAVWMRERLT